MNTDVLSSFNPFYSVVYLLNIIMKLHQADFELILL